MSRAFARRGPISSRLVACGVACALAFALASPARADEVPRAITLLGISGNGGPEIAAQLEQELGKNFDVVDGDVYRYLAEKLHKKGPSPAEVSEVCHKLRLDAVIAGAVRPLRGGLQLRIVVRDGGNGEVIGRVDRQLRRTELDARTRAAILDQVTVMVASAIGVEKRPRRAPVKPQPEEEPPVVDNGPEDNRAPEPPIDSEPQRPPEEMLRKVRPAAGAHAPITVDVGFGIMNRRLDIDGPGAVPYHGGVLSAVHVGATVYPFAWTRALLRETPILSAIGLDFSGTFVIPFTSQPINGPAINGHASHWDLSLLGRIPIKKSAAFYLAFGYGEFAYSSDDPTMLGVPDVTYRYLSPRIGFAVPLGSKAGLAANAALLLLVDEGAIGSDTGYGGGTAYGGQADLSFTVRPVAWLYFRAMGRYSGFALSFHGAGAMLANGARDNVFEAMLEVGYAPR